MTILKAVDLHRRFGDLEVLKGITMEVKEGELLSIVGASGAGKSTLLHLLGGLDRPDKGDVLYRGDSIFRGSEEELATYRNREVGFVFQFHHLLNEFTALENVMMPCLIARMDREEARERAEELLVRVGLRERLFHRPPELSGGEQQRVAVARALVMSPRILLADEPTGNLDTHTGEEVFSLLRSFNREGVTVVLVTHNEDLARRASRRIRIRDGLIEGEV